MGKRIQSFLIGQYPEIEPIFRVKLVPRLKPREVHLGEAIVEVVIGQMLSGKAADTIYARVASKRNQKQLAGSWQLSAADLRRCGLSRSKTRTIREFGAALEKSPAMLDEWRVLPPEDMMREVKSFWGMSEWTASILALFYLGHEDVFPKGDGTLVRALDRIAKAPTMSRLRLDPAKARPYRSYLALYLWQAIDLGAIG